MKFKGLNLRKLAAVAAIGGALFFGGNAVVNAAPMNDGMWAFREAYTAQTPDTRAFNQYMTMVTPNFHMDIDSKAQVLASGQMRMSGQLNLTYTNLKKNYSTNNTIPFYIEQLDNQMILYVQRRGKWNKMTLPGLPTGIALLWKSNNPAVAADVMNAVKSVEVLKDTPDLRIMNVTLDGAKVAGLMEKDSESSFRGLSGDDLAYQKEIFSRWLAAFRKGDITFTWTVNKPSWTTASATFDLTSIMRAYARYTLDESAAGRVVLTDEERDLLDAVGYYSELKSYTSGVSAKDSAAITVPDVGGAVENANAINDILYEMTTAVKK